MSVRFLYSNPLGRGILKVIQNSGALRLAARFLKSPLSRGIIKPYIKRNGIDMSEFEGQSYKCFADFFARTRDKELPESAPEMLISPCDSLVSIFPVDENTSLSIKDSFYRLEDIIPDKNVADCFTGGGCFIFRLCASDYHHFCYIDDCRHIITEFIPGKLHSVQPIACGKVPVYRLNRRQWTLMETCNFGLVAQIEFGAMMVGGIVHEKDGGEAVRGEEMGHFELAGSTVALLFTREVYDKICLDTKFIAAVNGNEEIRVSQGERLGRIVNEA